MFKKMGVAGKLISGFILVAVITAFVGFMGWLGITRTLDDVKSLGKESIPSIIDLEVLKVSLLEIKVATRTLTSPYLSAEDVERQFKNIEKSREKYKEVLADYDKISRTKEEERLYQILLPLIDDLRKKNNELIDMASDYKDSKVDKMLLSKKLSDFGMDGGQRESFDKMMASLQDLLDYVKKYYGSTLVDESIQQGTFLNVLIIIIAIAAFLIALIFGTFLSRSISKPVGRMTDDLYTSSSSLESAANQVSSSSQELSSGASELASSVEEMTSSLEELQSIIESNTKNINEAELLMRETNDGAQNSSRKMEDMQTAMGDINDNSKKIVKIIKVIDDIAFQTNILALNAAVEAARAGDAGRGFAVVAEQVKTLAQKSAEAAKETADLIDKAIESVSRGEQRGNEVKEVLLKAVDLASKVGTLLDEINRASKEQLKGATQVTKAVSQINTVVQGTAASSEETAAAGEELLSQSEMLKQVVTNLNRLVKGTTVTNGLEFKQTKLSPVSNKQPVPVLQKSSIPQKEVRALKAFASDEGIELIKPEDRIPLQDFKDF